VPGLFIVFEGIDGAGKSTQVEMLRNALLSRGAGEVEICREPGGTPLGESVRKVLLEPGARLQPAAEVLLYAACRAQLVGEVIRPALARGSIVIGDRFSDSTLAYQGFGRGFPLGFLEQLNGLATGGLQPHLTVLLDLPAERVFTRLAKKADRIEREGVPFFQKVREGYLYLARRGGSRYLVFDALLPVEEVHRRIWRAVADLLQTKSPLFSGPNRIDT
jgi:dTMP kinase